MRDYDRSSTGKRQLTSMGVTTQCEIEALAIKVQQAGRRVHKQYADTVGSVHRGRGVG